MVLPQRPPAWTPGLLLLAVALASAPPSAGLTQGLPAEAGLATSTIPTVAGAAADASQVTTSTAAGTSVAAGSAAGTASGTLRGAAGAPGAAVGAALLSTPGVAEPLAGVPLGWAALLGNPYDAILAASGSPSGAALALAAGAAGAPGQAVQGSPQAVGEDILELAEGPLDLGDLQKLILETSKAATGAGIKRLTYDGEDKPEALEAAIVDLYATLGYPLPPAHRAELHDQVMALDPRISGPTALILGAAVEAQRMVQRALHALDPDEYQLLWTCMQPTPAGPPSCSDPARAAELAVERLDRVLVTQAGLLLLSAIEEALPDLQRAAQSQLMLASSHHEPIFADLYKLVQIGGSGPDVYLGNEVPDMLDRRAQVLTLDLGGNDLYLNTAGGASADPLMGGAAPVSLPGALAPSQVATPVGGALGPLVSVTIDLMGNDAYTGTFGVQGSGRLGVGLLLDLGGDDAYQSSSESQGFGSSGVGLLVDAAGDDSFSCRFDCQGHGRVGGLGVLYDAIGHDRYAAESYAQGAGVSQGAGFLVDSVGHDSYSAVAAGAAISQGASHRVGLGVLADAGGHDSYALSPSGGRGYIHPEPLPFHVGMGIFRDKGGVDAYSGVPGGNDQEWGTGQVGSGKDQA